MLFVDCNDAVKETPLFRVCLIQCTLLHGVGGARPIWKPPITVEADGALASQLLKV